MNKIDLTQTGGMPFDQDTLGFSQTGITDTFAQLGGLLGSFIIISGTQSTGGWVSINGKIMPFDAGAGDPCYVRETTESVIFLDGESKPIYSTFKLVFGLGSPQLSWKSFKKLSPIIELQARLEELERKNAVFQTGGGMVLWNKPAILIPEGWQEVKDWQGRMPVGAGVFSSNTAGQSVTFNLGDTGGDSHHKNTIAEMVKHEHDYRDIYFSESGGSVAVPSGLGTKGGFDHDNAGYEMIRTSMTAGSGQAYSIMNPYRVVYFIEYIG